MRTDRSGNLLPLAYTTELYRQGCVVGKAVEFEGAIIFFKTTKRKDLLRCVGDAAGFDVRVIDHLAVERFIVCVTDLGQKIYYSTPWPPPPDNCAISAMGGEGDQYRVRVGDMERIVPSRALQDTLDAYTPFEISLDDGA